MIVLPLQHNDAEAEAAKTAEAAKIERKQREKEREIYCGREKGR